MTEGEAPQPTSSAGPRFAMAVLIVALIGAVGYIVHLRGQVGQGAARSAAPTSQPAAAAPGGDAVAAPAAGAVVISEEAIAAVLSPVQQQAMVDALKTQSAAERKAWFQIQQNNAETGAVQAALQRVFERAGWPTATAREPYPLKKGIFLLAGDDQPPPFVDTVIDAFNAAGIDAQYLTGYRSFYAERKQANPSWRGPELAADQAFTIVIGSKPTPKPVGGESSSQQ